MLDVERKPVANKPADPAEPVLPDVARATTDLVEATPPVDPKPVESSLDPELREALAESFRRNEAAYRYLGR